jgi:hypothetical protein
MSAFESVAPWVQRSATSFVDALAVPGCRNSCETQRDHTGTAIMNRLAPAEERKIGPKNDTAYVSPASIQHFTFAWGSKHIGGYLRRVTR